MFPVALSALLAVTPLQVRALRQLPLAPPAAALDSEFVYLTNARELADGRVLISTPDRGVLVVDLERGTIRPVGRKGRGPGEYELPGRAHALARDSSLIFDNMVRRWLVLSGSNIAYTMAPDHPAIVVTQGVAVTADSLGRVLDVATPPFEGERVVTRQDSSVVRLVHRATGRAETIARLPRKPMREHRYTDSRGRVTSSGAAPTTSLMSEEAAQLFPDGWVAVTRLEPFRVDWRRADGSWLRGAPLPVPVIRNTARERAARERRNGPARPLPPGIRPRGPSGAAATLPPYLGRGSLLTITDGRLLVERFPSADFEGTRYLVIDRRGQLNGEVVLPASKRIIGFGNGTVYIAERDADDILRLRRHPWPPR